MLDACHAETRSASNRPILTPIPTSGPRFWPILQESSQVDADANRRDDGRILG